MYHHYHKQAWASVLSGTEVNVSVMSVCIWSPCAWPVADWMRAVGLCPLWCSVTAGMGLSSAIWQHAKWDSSSAHTALSCESAPVHLFTESTNKPCRGIWHARQRRSTVMHVKERKGNLKMLKHLALFLPECILGYKHPQIGLWTFLINKPSWSHVCCHWKQCNFIYQSLIYNSSSAALKRHQQNKSSKEVVTLTKDPCKSTFQRFSVEKSKVQACVILK